MERVPAKTIVKNCIPNRNYLAFEYAMNIYLGCNHGCIYCYARSKYYEKTDNFECIRVKEDALRIVRDDLRRKTRKGVVLNGGVSDPYNLEEKEYKLTRCALELINAFEFGTCIITKSDLVTRDTDILLDIKENAPSSVNFSITCSDDETGKKIEPFASTTTERFKAIEHLSKNGLITGVLMDPVIPFITDTEENVREMVKKAKHYGAKYIYISTLVTMADVQRDYFYQEAEKFYPGISEKYKEKYGNYYRCWSSKSKKLWNTFVEACEKEGMNYNMRWANQMIRQSYKVFELNLNI
jgi:DNA repair photolyase